MEHLCNYLNDVSQKQRTAPKEKAPLIKAGPLKDCTMKLILIERLPSNV